MSSVWPRLEPLLPRVQKPARYIGCEDGAQSPEHAPSKTAWLLAYPDTYEIGLPNQGLQILYEILNERPDAVAERTYAPWTDLEELLRAEGVPAVLGRHPPRRRRLRHPRLQPLGRARLHERPQLHRPGRRPGPGRRPRARPPARSAPAGTAPTTPSRSPTSSTSSCWATARRWSREITEVVGAWKAGGQGRPQSRCCGRWPASRASTSRPCTRSTYDGPRIASVTPRHPGVPEQVEKRTIADLADWPYPRNQLVPLTEVVHDRLNVEVFRGCTRGLPVLPGRDDHPPGAGAAGRAGAHDGHRGPPPHRLRRGGAHVACPPPTSPASRTSSAGSWTTPGCGDVSVSLPSLRVDAFTRRHRRPDPAGPPHRPHLRPRGRHLAHAPGHQQADPRGGPLRRGRRGLQPGLAAGEALLPHRAAHRDRRGHARHRHAGPELRRDRPEAPQEPVGHRVGRRVRAQAVHAVPVVRPEHAGGAHPQDAPPPRRAAPRPGRPVQVARPEGHGGRGHRLPRRPPARAR